MVFNGQGAFIKKEEHAYHPDVVVLAQAKATMDADLCIEWAEKIHAPFAEKVLKNEPHIVFADNLAAQKMRGFVEKIKEANGTLVFGPPQRTEGWQPIDCGHIGATLKTMGIEKFEA